MSDRSRSHPPVSEFPLWHCRRCEWTAERKEPYKDYPPDNCPNCGADAESAMAIKKVLWPRDLRARMIEVRLYDRKSKKYFKRNKRLKSPII